MGVNGLISSSYYGYQEYLYYRGRFIVGNLLRGKVHWGNEELTWKNYALNLGLDIGLSSRVNVSFIGTRTTKDSMLMSKHQFHQGFLL